MNGVRSTYYMRKGYLLTALAAAVLLAASSGTAYAQQLEMVEITIEVPRSMPEGGDATITVRGKANVLMTPGDGDVASDRTVTVDVALVAGAAASGATMGEFAQEGQVNDAGIVSNPRVTLTFAENTGSTTRSRTATGSITVRANDDADAESERVMVTGDAQGGGNATVADPAPMNFTIADDETQTYVLVLDPVTHTSINSPKENGDIVVNLKAKPAHYQGGDTLTLQLSANGGRATGYTAMGPNAGSVSIGTDNPTAGAMTLTDAVNERAIMITTPANDKNRVTDVLALEAHSGLAGRDSLAASIDVEVLDIHMLPAADAITAVAKDEDGNEVTEIMEGGDPVFLTLTVDRGRGSSDRITDEELTVDIRASDAGQVADYELSESRIDLESRSSGKQSNDVDTKIELSARSDEDVGMEYLMLNLEVSGDKEFGTETSTGTFPIGIVDNTMKKVEPKLEEDAYPKIKSALGKDPETSVMNPGETGTIMVSDLFTVMDGYTASYGVSVEGGTVSVSSSSDSITVTASAVGESKVTVTARAKMTASSFLPEQTTSDAAHITFPVTVEEAPEPEVEETPEPEVEEAPEPEVEEAPEPEPVPALPVIAQWLLGLGLMGGGARQLFRRRRQG